MFVKKSFWLLILLLIILLAGYACHAPKFAVGTDNQERAFLFPCKPPALPVMEMTVSYTPPPIPEITPAHKDITLSFSSMDKSHVRSVDPRLFANGKTEIIDLPYLSEQEYALPLPGAKVISPYAGRRRSHSGIDLKTRANDTIVAAFDGVVRMAKSYAAYGNVIVLRHFNGLETVYSHNSKHLVKPGDTVEAGQPIALVGRTGRATTDHLHFETRINGQHFNPELVFNFNTRELRNKTLICTRKGNRIEVAPVDPFPYYFARLHAKEKPASGS